MDSPWDEHPESNNTLQELEWTKISSEFTNAGYREGITAGKESALQEGFDQGFAIAGFPIGRNLGLIRGIVSAILSSSIIDETSSSSSSSSSSSVVPPEIIGNHQIIMSEIQEINARLARIRFSDIILPPDLEAEEHARQHHHQEQLGEDDDGLLLEGVDGREGRELERLADLIEQMNTDDSEGAANGRVVVVSLLNPAKGSNRPVGEEDLEVLKNRLDQLVVQLGMNIN